jgi:hypothetical protein
MQISLEGLFRLLYESIHCALIVYFIPTQFDPFLLLIQFIFSFVDKCLILKILSNYFSITVCYPDPENVF